MSVTYNRAWAGLSLRSAAGVATSEYSHLRFYINPAGSSVPDVNASLYSSGGLIKQVDIRSYDSSNGNGWFTVSIPLADLGASNTRVYRVQLQDGSGRSQATFNIDSLSFVPGSGGSSNSSRAAAPSDDGGSSGGGSSGSGGSGAKYPSGNFKPSQCAQWVDNEIRNAVAKYNLPRWFYYAVVSRESSCNPNADNGRDRGLTQLGGSWYEGRTYPEWLNRPDDNNRDYYYNMNMPRYGKWILMSQVTPLHNWRDPKQNLDRYSSGYAVPAFKLFKRLYGESDTATLRRVAFHWNKGMYQNYNPGNCDYLCLYDDYVGKFKGRVEAQDGVWNGRPVLP
jgi:hypothetical protein